MSLNQNHISFEAENDVKKLLAPLTKLGAINYFCYGVNYPDTSGFSLHTHTGFYQSWFDNQFPLCGFHLDTGWYLWDNILPKQQIDVAREFNIGNGIIYIKHLENKTEVFSFATKPDSKFVLDFYMNNLNFLKRFSHYFVQNADNIIQIADKQRILPPAGMILTDPDKRKKFYNKESLPLIDRFLQELSYPFNVLSERESESYRLLIQGFSNTEISQKLGLSTKTVDVYINRIKSKLGCTNRKELVNKAHEAGIIEYYLDTIAS